MRMVKKVEDILIKIVRVIANLSLTEDVGEVIAESDKCIDLLMQTLGESSRLLNIFIFKN